MNPENTSTPSHTAPIASPVRRIPNELRRAFIHGGIPGLFTLVIAGPDQMIGVVEALIVYKWLLVLYALITMLLAPAASYLVHRTRDNQKILQKFLRPVVSALEELSPVTAGLYRTAGGAILVSIPVWACFDPSSFTWDKVAPVCITVMICIMTSAVLDWWPEWVQRKLNLPGVGK